MPFIARYRKERTGNLDEVAIRAILDGPRSSGTAWSAADVHRRARSSARRSSRRSCKEQILATFETGRARGPVPALQAEAEDEGATLAKEAGLRAARGLDLELRARHGARRSEGQTLELWAFTFRNEEKGFPDVGRRARRARRTSSSSAIAETQELRAARARRGSSTRGCVKTDEGGQGEAEQQVRARTSTYHEPIDVAPRSRRTRTATSRCAAGRMEEELTLSARRPARRRGVRGPPAERFERRPLHRRPTRRAPRCSKTAARIALKAHVCPSIENEVHRRAEGSGRRGGDPSVRGERAQAAARRALRRPRPCSASIPGMRTGCKLAVVDDSGKYVANDGHPPAERRRAKAHAKDARSPSAEEATGARRWRWATAPRGRETEIFLRDGAPGGSGPDARRAW